MNKKDYEALRQALERQHKEVTSSKKAAEKFLREAGVWHLLVPKEGNKKKSASKSR